MNNKEIKKNKEIMKLIKKERKKKEVINSLAANNSQFWDV